MKSTKEIGCNFELSSLLIRWIGCRFMAIHIQKGTFTFGNQPEIFTIKDIILGVYNESNMKYESFVFTSRGNESYAGDLFGVEINQIEIPGRRFDDIGYNFGLRCDFGLLKKIVGIGEVRKENVFTAGQEEAIECFFPAGMVLPDIISIDKKTLEVIGFQFDTGKWLYLFPQGEGYFRIEIASDTSPEELINNWETIDDEPKPLQILQVFE